MSTMNTLICQEPKKLVWKEREIPIPGEGEALIKIKSVGICGTDIHAWGGNQPFFSYPRVLGHEICGEIVGLGKNIQNLKNGQQVAVIPYVACQQCPACLSGRTNCCEKISVIGVHQDGGFSEYLSVPVTNLLDAQGIDPQAAALIEPYAISAHAVRRAAVAPGLFKIDGDRVLLLLDAAEWPEDIDVNRALRARREAEEELRQKRSMAEYQLAQGNLARALNRLRISGRM